MKNLMKGALETWKLNAKEKKLKNAYDMIGHKNLVTQEWSSKFLYE